MPRIRLLFEKAGRAQYISHLDLMRTFQRVFIRAGIRLRHTEGFNPHPYMSFALPLPVGVESLCELADIDLLEDLPLDALPALLNRKMPEGLRAVRAYIPETKFTGIASVSVAGRLIYDNRIPAGTPERLNELFEAKELLITKKTKKGASEINIAPYLHNMRFDKIDDQKMIIAGGELSAQNPTINPENVMTAIRTLRPELAPDFASFIRLELLDAGHTVFR